ncbi:MAG TPA: 6-phosphogluconolactonase [Bryobacteraceae bacterium]|nr:6-phosphogluconolactonase [Bryobacteraceae bacterium]
MKISRHDRAPDAAGSCGDRILELLDAAIRAAGVARIAISGGSSPRPMFEKFAVTKFDWDRVQLFWVDERGVPPEDSQSNFKFANETWLAPGKFPATNIHRIQAELDPHQAARIYTQEITDSFALTSGDQPRFDVIHLGMGPDAHTASLFPGEPLIDNRRGIASATYVEKFKQWRITLLPGVLLAARNVVMLITGADKAEPLKAVLDGRYDPKQFPAQVVVRNAASLNLFVDEAAAAEID